MNRSGFTLIEVIAALGIAGLVLVPLFAWARGAGTAMTDGARQLDRAREVRACAQALADDWNMRLDSVPPPDIEGEDAVQRDPIFSCTTQHRLPGDQPQQPAVVRWWWQDGTVLRQRGDVWRPILGRVASCSVAADSSGALVLTIVDVGEEERFHLLPIAPGK